MYRSVCCVHVYFFIVPFSSAYEPIVDKSRRKVVQYVYYPSTNTYDSEVRYVCGRIFGQNMFTWSFCDAMFLCVYTSVCIIAFSEVLIIGDGDVTTVVCVGLSWHTLVIPYPSLHTHGCRRVTVRTLVALLLALQKVVVCTMEVRTNTVLLVMNVMHHYVTCVM